jgi:hypothetical protein
MKKLIGSFIEKKCPWHDLRLTGLGLNCEKCGLWLEERVIRSTSAAARQYLPGILEDNLQTLKEYYDEKRKSQTA